MGPRKTTTSKKIKKQQADRTIHNIRDINTNQKNYEPKEIETNFMDYYELKLTKWEYF